MVEVLLDAPQREGVLVERQRLLEMAVCTVEVEFLTDERVVKEAGRVEQSV